MVKQESSTALLLSGVWGETAVVEVEGGIRPGGKKMEETNLTTMRPQHEEDQ